MAKRSGKVNLAKRGDMLSIDAEQAHSAPMRG
jgi:hypothetical protein